MRIYLGVEVVESEGLPLLQKLFMDVAQAKICDVPKNRRYWQRGVMSYKTYREYLNHPEFKKIRAIVMDRSSGMCEKCGTAKATEVHHLKYPKWGTFDTPDNLISVCHQCHCKVHGVKT